MVMVTLNCTAGKVTFFSPSQQRLRYMTLQSVHPFLAMSPARDVAYQSVHLCLKSPLLM